MTPDTVTIRELHSRDLDDVVRIDAMHTGELKPAYKKSVFDDYLRGPSPRETFGFGAENADGRVVGYVLGEVRAVEFGSEPCGWVFAVGVDRSVSRMGVASALLEATVERFRTVGVDKVRTMVRRGDLPVLSFFRSANFVGGPFVQLELDCRR